MSEPQVPLWMNQEAIDTLSRGYLRPGETPRKLFERLSKTAKKYLTKTPGIEEDIFEIFWKGYLGGASPVLSNFGASTGLPISCYSSHLSDSRNSIYSHLKEASALSQYGGGVGEYFGEIRPAGAPISGGGKSSGVVPWMRQYDQCAAVVSQGGVRRGSFALYLPIDHPDLPELLRAKDHTQGDPRDFIDSNIAVTITDEWIEDLLKGDLEKKKLWGEVIKTRLMCGSPYLIFIDNANNTNPDCYKQRGLSVKLSNLCFTGDTLVAVADGRNAVPISELVDTNFNVYSARKRKSRGGFINQWVTEIKPAIAFKTGTKEIVEVELEDGSIFRCTPDHLLAHRDCSWVEAKDSVGEVLEPFSSFINNCGHRMINTISNGTARQSRMIWENKNGAIPPGYQVDHVVSQIKNNGLKVVSVRPAGIEDVYDLTVEDNHNFYIITNNKENSLLSGVLVHNCSEIFLHTDENHTFVCVLSSLNLAKWDEWKDWRGPNTGKSVPELGIYFLDAVVEEFIHKASRMTSMGRAVRFAKKSRALGLGVMGLHSLYQSKSLPFASQETRELNKEIHKLIRAQAEQASMDMAIEYGEPEWCEGSGRRHTHLIAIAPTKSNSVICGAGSEGIEPMEDNYYSAPGAKGTFIRKNRYFEQYLDGIGKNTEEVWESILDFRGSVQHLDFLDDHAKQVFKTAHEIDQFELIRQASDRQPYICQGQSLNLRVHPESSPEYLTKLHLSAWKAKLKSIYYLKSKALLVKNRPTAQKEAIIVTKKECPYCSMAKSLLRSQNWVVKEIDRAEYTGEWKEEWKTMPQIWLQEQYIGGYNDLVEHLRPKDVEKVYAECAACGG